MDANMLHPASRMDFIKSYLTEGMKQEAMMKATMFALLMKGLLSPSARKLIKLSNFAVKPLPFRTGIQGNT